MCQRNTRSSRETILVSVHVAVVVSCAALLDSRAVASPSPSRAAAPAAGAAAPVTRPSALSAEAGLEAATRKVADRLKDPVAKLLASASSAKNLLVVVVPDTSGEPDRPAVLNVLRSALVRRANDAGRHAIASAGAGSAWTASRSTPLEPAVVKSLKATEGLLPAGETFDAVLYAGCSTRRGVRSVRVGLVSEQQALGTVETVQLPPADLSDLPKPAEADVRQADDEITDSLRAALAGSDNAAKAFPKISVVVGAAPGGTRVAEVVRGQLLDLLPSANSAAPETSRGSHAASSSFDVSTATQIALASAKRGPLMTAAESERPLKGAAYQAILSAACSQGGGGKPATVEFALLSGKSVAWKTTLALNDWALASIPPVPLINQKIVSFARAHMRQQVGNGECWTLAAEAMKDAGAQRPDGYTFGRLLAAGDVVLPGDIMQFTSVRLERPGHWENLGSPNHTAVVEVVMGPKKFKVLHQNAGAAGKTVSNATLDMSELKSGTYQIFRPAKAKPATEPTKTAGA